MALTRAQRIFGKILQQNLAGPMNIGPSRALPKNFKLPSATPTGQGVDPASFILARSSVGKVKPLGQIGGQSLASRQEDDEPGVVSKIFDTLSIPLNTAMNLYDNAVDVVQGEQSVGGAIKDQLQEVAFTPARLLDNATWKPNIPGLQVDDRFWETADRLANKSDRTFGSDVLENAGVENKWGKILGGLALDIAADPLNAIPGVGFGRAAGRALKASDELQDAAAARPSLEAGMPVREARQLIENQKLPQAFAPNPRPEKPFGPAPSPTPFRPGGTQVPDLKFPENTLYVPGNKQGPGDLVYEQPTDAFRKASVMYTVNLGHAPRILNAVDEPTSADDLGVLLERIRNDLQSKGVDPNQIKALAQSSRVRITPAMRNSGKGLPVAAHFPEEILKEARDYEVVEAALNRIRGSMDDDWGVGSSWNPEPYSWQEMIDFLSPETTNSILRGFLAEKGFDATRVTRPKYADTPDEYGEFRRIGDEDAYLINDLENFQPRPIPTRTEPFQGPISSQVLGSSSDAPMATPGAEFGRNVTGETFPEVTIDPDKYRPGQTMMHGTENRWDTSAPPESIWDTPTPGEMLLYGRGLYTTKAPELAGHYSGTYFDGGDFRKLHNARTQPAVHTFRWNQKRPPKLFDMNKKASKEVIKWGDDIHRLLDDDASDLISIENFPSTSSLLSSTSYRIIDDFHSTLQAAKDPKNWDKWLPEQRYSRQGNFTWSGPVTNEELDFKIRDLVKSLSRGVETRENLITIQTQRLMSSGYDGITHTGGRFTGGMQHEVNIFFDTSKLDVGEYRNPLRPHAVTEHTGAAGPPITPAEREALGKPILANPFDPETDLILQRMQQGLPWAQPAKPNMRSINAKLNFTGDKLNDSNMAKKGIVAKKGKISIQAVNKVIDDIRAGKIGREEPPVAPLANEAMERSVKKIADRFLNETLMTGKKISFTPNQQVNLYARLYNSIGAAAKRGKIKLSPEEHHLQTLSSLRFAEDHLTNLGKNPQYWNGQEVRLSSVLAETKGIDPDEVLKNFAATNWEKVDNSIVREALNRALARRSVLTGGAIAHLGRLAADAKASIDTASVYRYPREKQAIDDLVQNITRLGDESKLTPTEVDNLKDLIKQSVDINKLPTDLSLAEVGPLLTKAVADGRVDASVVSRQSKAIAQIFGKKTIQEIGDPIRQTGAIPAFMMRFTTWWGRKDVHPYELDTWGWGEANARQNGEKMRNIQKNFTSEEIRAAWSIAARNDLPADSSRVAGLSNVFRKEFEHMFGSSGLKEELAKGTADFPVAMKSQLAMRDINKQLERLHVDFKFTNKRKVTLQDGTIRNYSKGTDWLNSWESYTPTDPAAFMYDTRLAMERVTKRYIFLDELGERFGSRRKQGIFQHEIPEPRLHGVYFPEEIRNQVLKSLKAFDEPMWRPTTRMGIHHLTKGTRIWKIGVTLYNPVHHIRNLIGDSWLMWMGGINDPKVFIKSRRILHTQRNKYREILGKFDPENPMSSYTAMNEGIDELTGRYAAEWAATKSTDVISRIKKGNKTTDITAEEYYVQAHKHNLLLDANAAEDVFGQSPFGRVAKWSPVSKTHHVVTNVAEYREHYIRMAHFIGAVEKQMKAGLSKQQAFDKAAHMVRKWHPDGRDLTSLEQDLRVFIPFYSWMRKSTPLILQSLVQSPAKNLAYPKIMQSVQQSLGIEGSIEDPFPDDQLFPDWVRAYGIGPVGNPQAGGLAGVIGNLGRVGREDYTNKPIGYTVINPSNPMIDFVAQYLGTGRPIHDPGTGALESITPFARIPYELATGREVSDQPISSDPSGYVGENIPFVAPASRIFNVGPFGPSKQAEEDGTFDREALINWATGAGLRGTGPYITSSEFDARERAKRFAERRIGKRPVRGY